MTLLVTGGTGFVMSNFVLLWLTRHPRERAVVVDLAEPDSLCRRFFASVLDRIRFVAGDVADRDLWESLPAGVEWIVHGAAVTPSGIDEERAKARATVEVNVMGTLNALDWARRQPTLRRFLQVSTGGVYVDEDPRDPLSPLPEEGFVDPAPGRLYPITKRASELLAWRCAALWSLPLAVVRLSSVFGPMDRPTAGRRVRCVPNVACHLALEGRTIGVSGLAAVGDYVHAGDVAAALATLASAETLEHAAYNIAAGSVSSVETVLRELQAILPDTAWAERTPQEADLVENPAKATGKWGAYDISRLRALGWEPRSLREGLADYVAWIRENRA